jgi:hypothetical protein
MRPAFHREARDMRTTLAAWLLPIMLLSTGSAGAQRLPDVGVPGAGLPLDPVQAPLQTIDALAARGEGRVADIDLRTAARALARREPRRVALDPDGAAILRGAYLAIDADAAALAAARAAGFAIDVDSGPHADALGLSLVRLRDLRDRPPARALRALRAAMPQAQATFDHLYFPAGMPSSAPPATERDTAPSRMSSIALHAGMIDGGVDAALPALHAARIERHGCDGRAVPQAHGGIVASRLFAGEPGVLHAADLWCGDRVGGGTGALVDALDWMARQRVPVINVSLVGPDNPVLRRVVAAMIARGHVLVAAAGNVGPAAPPQYPAAYPGVVAVAAVDARMRALPESASGPQIAFCAIGVLDAPASAKGAPLRGTSYAAPVVARLFAERLALPSPDGARRAFAALVAQSRDLGARGRDDRYGHGLLSPGD